MVSPKQDTVMTGADLFRQYAQEAMRWSSSKSTSTDERRALDDQFTKPLNRFFGLPSAECGRFEHPI